MKPSWFLSDWEQEYKNLIQENLNRELTLNEALDFSSNDYLSLRNNPFIRKTLIQELKKGLPFSSNSSRLIRGHSHWHEETEDFFRKWIQRPSVLFFGSGYLANMGLIHSVCKESVIFSDELNHASLIDACRFSKKTYHIYKHKNMNQLEDQLKKEKNKKKVILTESLFSMDGDFAPLKDLSDLALKHQALLIVDEAHATGIYGPGGRGLSASLKSKEHIISVHPCGKALATSGAFVAGPKILAKYLSNTCRTFIYTTAPSPLLLFHIKQILITLKNQPNRRKILKKNSSIFRKLLQKFTSIGNSESQIVPVFLGQAKKALHLSEILKNEGYDIRAIRYPTVAKQTERLRICVHYNHPINSLKKLARILEGFFK